jgi:hypothetical protein
VSWEPLWIKLPVDFRFLAIQPGGNFVLQRDPFRIEANIAGKRVAMTRKVWGGRSFQRNSEREYRLHIRPNNRSLKCPK